MFGTLQKRLPQELRLAGITTMDEANRFLDEVFVALHNARFARPAEEAGSAFVPFAGTLQIPPDRHRHHYVKAKVRVHEYPDGTLAVFLGPRYLARYRADGTAIETTKRHAA